VNTITMVADQTTVRELPADFPSYDSSVQVLYTGWFMVILILLCSFVCNS